MVVTNPDESTITLPGGFTIEEGRAAQVWVDIIGRDIFLGDREFKQDIVYGNSGNVNAYGVYCQANLEMSCF